MANEKHHIDDLFSKLKNLRPEITDADWDLLKDAMHDGAWKEKFENFEPESTEFIILPPADSNPIESTIQSKFENYLPLNENPELEDEVWSNIQDKIHDNAWKEKFEIFEPDFEIEDPFLVGNLAKKQNIISRNGIFSYALLFGVLAAMIFTTWIIFSNKKEVVEIDYSHSETTETHNATVDHSDENHDFNQENKINAKREISTSNDLEKSNTHTHNSKPKTVVVSEKNESNGDLKKEGEKNGSRILQEKSATDYQNVEKFIKEVLEKPKDETVNYKLEIVSTEKESEISAEINEMTEDKNLHFEIDLQENVNDNIAELKEEKEGINNKNRIYVIAGMGASSLLPPYKNASPMTGFSMSAMGGVQWQKVALGAGIAHQNISYTNNSILIRKVDSVPHLNSLGDTIGWFQRNARDTLENGTFNSRISVVTIPVRINTKLFTSNRFELWAGGGANLDIFSHKGVYAQDRNQYNVSIPKGSADIRRYAMGYHADIMLNYKLNKTTGLYVECNYWGNSNISKINDINLRTQSISVNFGLKYLLK